MFNFANFPPQYSIVNYFQVMKHEEKLELTDYLFKFFGFGIISRGFQVWFFLELGLGFSWFKVWTFWRGLNGFDPNDFIFQ